MFLKYKYSTTKSEDLGNGILTYMLLNLHIIKKDIMNSYFNQICK